jgi:Glycosyl hydrolases family 18
VDPEPNGGLHDRAPDDSARDPYDQWLVRYPGLHRAVRAYRGVIGLACVVILAAVFAPAAVSALSHRGKPAPSAAAPPTTTSTTARPHPKSTTSTTTTTAPAKTTTSKPAKTTTTTSATAPLAEADAYPDPFQANAQLVPASTAATATVADLAAASAAPPPTPAIVANAPPLKTHERFGFAPYWTLSQQAGFTVSGLTTIAYFNVAVNPDGSLSESGAGWNGYVSQDFADLVTRAHAAGDHVVLTVTDYDEGQLEQLLSSPTAPGTLATALAFVLDYRHLNGVNFDFETTNSVDAAGLTNLVTRVSGLLKQVNPHYQVTMDTPANAASTANGPYDITKLARALDAFFVMDYNPNVGATESATSPLTSGLVSDQAAAQAYTARAPAAKVILGLPAFGVDWPTTDGTLHARATGPATATTLGDLLSSGHPRYWDATTQSGWTSYQVGTQWHETFYESPTSYYLAERLAAGDGLGGVGLWALGLDANDPSDLSALLGVAPAVAGGPAGPASTSRSPAATASTAPPTSAPTTTPASVSAASAVSAPPRHTAPAHARNAIARGAPGGTGATATVAALTSETTGATAPAPFRYTGIFGDAEVTLRPIDPGAAPAVAGVWGQLTAFVTDDPAAACLTAEAGPTVYAVRGDSSEFLVRTTSPADCTTADFVFTTP